MRHYQSNSPESMSHKRAVCLLSRGHFRLAEREVLDRFSTQARQLLNRSGVLSVAQTLYDDLTRCGQLILNDVRHVDPVTHDWLAVDVQDRRDAAEPYKGPGMADQRYHKR